MSDFISGILKSDNQRKRSYKDLKNSLETIEIEHRLLQNLCAEINDSTSKKPEIDRALRDSFLMHFRRIHNFLYSKKTESKTITAEDYFEKSDEWTSKRIKETKRIKDLINVANKMITEYSYVDDVQILELNTEEFKNVVDEIDKPFSLFINMITGKETAEVSEEVGNEQELPLETTDEYEEVIEDFGGNKVMYRTILREEGILEVQVRHENSNVRKLIANHIAEPEYFYDHLDNFVDHRQMARRSLAEVVKEYPTYFEENKVNFVMVD